MIGLVKYLHNPSADYADEGFDIYPLQLTDLCAAVNYRIKRLKNE